MTSSFQMGVHLSELPKASEWLREQIEKQGISEKNIFALDLALEEIITNIIKYSNQQNCEQDTIEIELEIEKQEVKLTIQDCGCYFNPLEVPPPTQQTDVQSMKVGGLGIHLTRNLMDNMDYQRIGNKNVLTLTKALEKEGK